MPKSLHPTPYTLHPRSSRRGQSIAEVLIAVAMGVILVGAAASLILPSLKGSTQATNVEEGSTLANGLLENVRAYSEGSWNNLLALATGSANTYFLQTAHSPFVAASGTEAIPYDGITSGLVGEWKFGEGSGSSTIDSSGSGNVGTWGGTPIGTSGTYYAAGHVGQYAGDFDGSTDYVKSQSNIPLSGNFAGTISLWVYFQSVSSGFHAIADFGQTGTDQGFSIFQGPLGVGNVTIGFYGSQNCNTATGVVTTGQWYHLVATKIPGPIGTSTTVLYLNNVPQSLTCNTSSTPNLQLGLLYVGSDVANEYSNSELVDDVRIYNRALSSGEITQIYNDSYKRYFYLNDVYRAGSGTITTSGGSYDPSTKRVMVGYSWPGEATQTLSEYLTRSENFILDQTDWSGGAAISGTIATTTNSQFATSSNVDYSTTTGSFYLAIPGY